MQFTPTNVEPSPSSKVTVTFGGLMLLKPGPDNTLEVGIHKYSRDHAFQVMLIVQEPERPPRVIRLLSGPLFADFEMIVSQPGEGVRKFVTRNEIFDGKSEGNNERDFRWAFNFGALPGHEDVDFNDGARPIAKLNSGVLYTPSLSRKNLGLILKSGHAEMPLPQFSVNLAASVDLPEETRMTLKWTELGVPRQVVLPREPADRPGTTYTVALVNDPADIDPAPHDEFKEYYKILQIDNQPVPDDLQWEIGTPPDHLSDEIPCLTGVMEPPGHSG